ncbi:MAG: DUF4492 domain-containing protein [Bacteroidales bacterium]|nr:DUF4492 domain-containing protein [Bacteroidales bacterium]
MKKYATRIFNFYKEGFQSMTYGKTLWIIILIKLFIMFAILKLFFFQDDLSNRAQTEQEKSDYVLEQLISP